MCQRWGIGPTAILESEDAGYVLAIMRAVGDGVPASSEDDAMRALLVSRSVPCGE